ncbi:MAG TPA: hypothetical protein VIV60_11765 [Polyangiaceae bacterium]
MASCQPIEASFGGLAVPGARMRCVSNHRDAGSIINGTIAAETATATDTGLRWNREQDKTSLKSAKPLKRVPSPWLALVPVPRVWC